jgi:hypothetical protein
VAQRIFDLLEVVRGHADGRGAGAGRRAGGTVRSDAPAARPAPRRGPDAQDGTSPPDPDGGAAQPAYPFGGPAPEDTRAGSPPRRLDLPEIRPRTRPGRTG